MTSEKEENTVIAEDEKKHIENRLMFWMSRGYSKQQHTEDKEINTYLQELFT
jgi:hypothetical protein